MGRSLRGAQTCWVSQVGRERNPLYKKKKEQSPSGRLDGGREGKKEKGASGRICRWNARRTWLGRQGVHVWSESGPFWKILECVFSGIKTYQFFIPFEIKHVFAMNVTLGWCSSERSPVWKQNREQPALCGLHTFNVRSASNDSLAYPSCHPCPPQHPFPRGKKKFIVKMTLRWLREDSSIK